MNECYGSISRWQMALEEYLVAKEAISHLAEESIVASQFIPFRTRPFIAMPAINADEFQKPLWRGMTRVGFLKTIGKWMRPLTGGFIHEHRIAESNCGFTFLFH